ncbi:MAG: hypothetical protein ACE5HI_14105 [bacterium]
MNNKDVPKEPVNTIDIHAIRNTHAGETCPICQGYGRLKCAVCEDGQIRFLGGLQACSHCFGSGLKPCVICAGRGWIKENSRNYQ